MQIEDRVVHESTASSSQISQKALNVDLSTSLQTESIMKITLTKTISIQFIK